MTDNSGGNRPPVPPPLEVRELRYFQAVAEELNFSRAAERLGIAQPPLSRAIRQLERRLGVRLFNRDHHGVELTEAGASLLADAPGVLDAVTAAANRARQAALTQPQLVITAKPGPASVLLQHLIDAYKAAADPRHELADIEVLVSGYGEQAELVRTGRADMALIGPPHQRPGLAAEPLLSEPRVAVLPAGHGLAQRGPLRCADLVGYPMPHRANAPDESRRFWSGRDRVAADGGDPALPEGPVVHDTSQLLEVVALGQAIALLPRSLAARNQRPDIVYRPVADATPYTIALIWRTEARDRHLAEFVRAATEYAAQAAPGGRRC